MSKFKEICHELFQLNKPGIWSENAKVCLETSLTNLLKLLDTDGNLLSKSNEDLFYMIALETMKLVVPLQSGLKVKGLSDPIQPYEVTNYILKSIRDCMVQQEGIYYFDQSVTGLWDEPHGSLINNFRKKVLSEGSQYFQDRIEREFNSIEREFIRGLAGNNDYEQAVTQLKDHVLNQFKAGHPEFTYKNCMILCNKMWNLNFASDAESRNKAITEFQKCAQTLFKGPSKAVQILLRIVATIVGIAAGIAAGFAVAGPVGAVVGGVAGAGVGLFATRKIGETPATKVLDAANKLNTGSASGALLHADSDEDLDEDHNVSMGPT